MIIPINISKSKISKFIDYLQVVLRSKGKYRRNASYDKNGNYIQNINLPIKERGYESSKIQISISWEQDGTLAPINTIIKGKPYPNWERIVEKIIRDALIATINAKNEKHFFRYCFAYIGPPMDGEYFIEDFRIAPAVCPDTELNPFAERVINIDLYGYGVDRLQANTIGKIHAKQITALLSVFLNFGFYEIPHELRWVYTETHESIRCQLGFHTSTKQPKRMPEEGEEYSCGTYYSTDRKLLFYPIQPMHLKFPKDIKELFHIFYQLPSEDRESYLGAASLYNIALTAGRYFPTLSLSYIIASADALIQGKKHTKRAFNDLIQKHCSEAPKDFGSDIYSKIRSTHFHCGSLPGGEYELLEVGPIINPKYFNKSNYQYAISTFIYNTLIRWLLKRKR